jgi:hypothetical protein
MNASLFSRYRTDLYFLDKDDVTTNEVPQTSVRTINFAPTKRSHY